MYMVIGGEMQNLLFIVEGDKNWIGGVYYIRNIIFALRQIEKIDEIIDGRGFYYHVATRSVNVATVPARLDRISVFGLFVTKKLTALEGRFYVQRSRAHGYFICFGLIHLIIPLTAYAK